MNEPLLIRRSTGEDRAAIRELAGLDSRRPPDGPVLLAFIGTELRAALPLDGQAPVADPFHATAEIVALLRVCAIRAQRDPGRTTAARRFPLRVRPA